MELKWLTRHMILAIHDEEVTMMVGMADGTVDAAMLASWLARFSKSECMRFVHLTTGTCCSERLRAAISVPMLCTLI